MSTSLGLLITFAQVASGVGCQSVDELLASVDRDFRAGQLEVAISKADLGLSCSNATVDQRVTLYLKLSGIHDRIGLHTNTRPVAAALKSIESAFSLADRASPATHATIDLAKARYHYRAESSDSNYPLAREYCLAALSQFEDLADFRGQADAVHLIGLFHLQRRELPEAQRYFDRSLRLEMQAGAPRPVFLADYERHTGYVQQWSGDLSSAIGSFERSFDIRRKNGLIDQSMFAAISLGRVLVDANRAADAEAPLEYALQVAEQLNSTEGRARAERVLGDMQEQQPAGQ